MGVRLWNDLPAKLQNTVDKYTFSNIIKKYIERTFLNMLFIYLSADAEFSYTMIDVESLLLLNVTD